MANIDRQRIDAVAKLMTLGYRWSGTAWVEPPATLRTITARDMSQLSPSLTGHKPTHAEDLIAEILRAGYWPPGAEYPTHWDLYRLNCAVRAAFIYQRGLSK